MRVDFRKSDRVRRRAMPIATSNHWKPVHDPHYVLASLQRGKGGRREVFINQSPLWRIQALVRASGKRVLGLLVGERLECPIAGTGYVLIESIVEGPLVPNNESVRRREPYVE